MNQAIDIFRRRDQTVARIAVSGLFLDFDPVLDELQPHERRRDVDRKILLTESDLLRLAEMIQQARHVWPNLNDLERKLKEAVIVPADELPDSVVAMHSTVAFRDLHSGERETYQLVYPEQADLDRARLSVLAPVGSALLGEREGAAISWAAPCGRRAVKIECVSRSSVTCGIHEGLSVA
jgi:regulator of nucleoside diphosphate kinase